MVIFGIQHYMYVDFVITLMPEWIAGRRFWAYIHRHRVDCGGRRHHAEPAGTPGRLASGRDGLHFLLACAHPAGGRQAERARSDHLPHASLHVLGDRVPRDGGGSAVRRLAAGGADRSRVHDRPVAGRDRSRRARDSTVLSDAVRPSARPRLVSWTDVLGRFSPACFSPPQVPG